MKEKIKRSQVIKKRIVKSILWLVLTPFILLALVALLIHLPPVQNYISGRITTYLTEGTGYKTEIDYINIKWFNAVSVDGTKIYDLNDVKMIGIDEMVLTFKLSDLIGKQNFETGQAWVKGADVNLRDETSRRLNIDDWVIKLGELFASAPADGPVEPAAFTIDEITLLESKFSISDKNRDSVQAGFDYNHFQLLDLNANLLNLKAVADTFQIDVKYLSAVDSASGLQIDELKTFFRNSWKQMAFFDLDLKMGKTRITDEIIFDMNKPSDMGYFVDSIDIRANFDHTILHTDELSYFVPDFKKHNEQVKLDGFFEGPVSDFFSDDFQLEFGEQTVLRGSIQLTGLPDIEATDFSIALNNSSITADDFKEYIGSRAYDITSKLGLVNLKGNFIGYINDFVADGEFDTEIGYFSSDTKIQPIPGELAQYDGGLIMKDFDLGIFTGDSIFQTVDMDGKIEGSGFTIENASFILDASIPRIGINGYDYQNIETDGAFAQSFFEGELTVLDPNIVLSARGSVDLRDQKQIFKIGGDLDTTRLQALNIIDEDVTIASNFDIDITGIQLDSILGNLGLKNTYLKYQENDIVFDSLLFDSQRDINGRKVRFATEDQFDVQLNGQFEFTNLLDELQTINEEYRLIFSSRLQEVDEFLAKNKTSETPFNIAYRADLRDISPILQLFDTSLYVSQYSNVQGRFTNEQNTNLSVSANADTVKWANIWFYENIIAINSEDLRNASDVFTQGYLSSERQRYANTSETKDLTLTAKWDGRHIDIEQRVEQESSGNFAELGADIDFYPDSTVLKFKESTLQALNEEWKIQKDNRIIFGERRIDIKNLSVYNSDQSISFDGEVAVTKDSSKTLGIEFTDVSVANINPLTSKTYTGKLGGKLSARNIYFNPILYGRVQLEELRVNNFLVGDLDGSLTWNDFRKKFDLDFTVERLGKKIISLSGDFLPSNKVDQLKLDLELNDANLRIAEPFIDEYFTEMGGYLTGKYTVSGTTRAPVIEGIGALKEAQMKINYLNTKYDFDGNVSFKKDLIELSNINFVDEIGSQADFRGTVEHKSFSDFKLNLLGDLNEFQVLNTIDTIGEPYYGTAYATGRVELSGEASNLTIAADVQTSGETRLFIPISEGTDQSDNPEYITFIDRTDTTQVDPETPVEEDVVNKIKIEGLNLDLNIGVTPDAYVEIIIDPKSGDIIRGRGNGLLRLQIDSQGEFKMTGGLNISEGGYNFSLYNIITKEFDIEQPSSINWYGDPYAGVMNLNASFSQNTSIQPVLEQAGLIDPSQDTGANSGVNRRFPTKVLLSLDGPMLSPEIKFDIDFSEIQSQENQVAINAFKNRLLSDEQELNRQVLSLIVLNRFSDQGGITIGGRTATQNVSQFLSNQFSQLIAQLDENLEVDLDLADLDQDAFNTFRLRLSYTFLDGRLRITREGGLTNLVDVNSIAGDWTAEYLLTDDGRYKVKVYSRSNYDLTDLVNSRTATTNTTGASITQTTSFNSFKEFFSGVNKKRKKRKETDKDEDIEPVGGN